jgi:hypothetical protein
VAGKTLPSQSCQAAHFVGLFGFFLLIMITLGAKTINACEVVGFPSTPYPDSKVKVRQHLSSKQAIVIGTCTQIVRWGAFKQFEPEDLPNGEPA